MTTAQAVLATAEVEHFRRVRLAAAAVGDIGAYHESIVADMRRVSLQQRRAGQEFSELLAALDELEVSR